MLDVILDGIGVLLLFGQAALFLATGQIEALPCEPAPMPGAGDDGCSIWP